MFRQKRSKVFTAKLILLVNNLKVEIPLKRICAFQEMEECISASRRIEYTKDAVNYKGWLKQMQGNLSAKEIGKTAFV